MAVRIEVVEDGITLAAWVRRALPDASWSRARDLCRTERVRIDERVEADGAFRPQRGAHISIEPEGRKRTPGVLHPDQVVFEDNDVIVVRKRPNTLTVPFDAGDRDTLRDQVAAYLRRGGKKAADVGVVQRLDKDTTGILVFALTLNSKRRLEEQLRDHTVLRRYVAIAYGDVPSGAIESVITKDRGDGLRGSEHLRRKPSNEPGQWAKTHITALERFGVATMVGCRLETGRQHQIRIHLAESGHPLLGERVYNRGSNWTDLGASRPMLHAEVLGFVHPRTGNKVEFEDPPPEDFRSMIERLRALRKSGAQG